MKIFVFASYCTELCLYRLCVLVNRVLFLSDGEHVSAFGADPSRVVLLDDNVVIGITQNLDNFARALLFLLFGIRIRCRFANAVAGILDSGRCRTLSFASCRYLSASSRSRSKEPFDALLTTLEPFQAEEAESQLRLDEMSVPLFYFSRDVSLHC